YRPIPDQGLLGGEHLAGSSGDAVVQVGGSVEIPVELGAGHPDMVGYLLGRCLRPVVRDRLERGFDELRATLLPLSRPAGRPAVNAHSGRHRRTHALHGTSCPANLTPGT